MRLPAAGAESLRGVPARQGQGPFLFLRKKKRALTPRQNEFHSAPSPCGGYPLYSIRSSSPHKSSAFAGPPGARSMSGLGWKTAACGFTLCGEDHSRPLRPCHWGTGKGLWFYPAAAWMCHSRGRVRRWCTGVSRTNQVPLSAAKEAQALREAPAGGGWVERRPVPVPQGQAVTAGSGPRSHTKAAGRRFRP